MSRVSDTRQRTREAAAALVAGGKRPHELTVDLIYAAIQQGSRTTINDELKLWKDERAKADALGADLPPAIADAMRLLWAAAVEQGGPGLRRAPPSAGIGPGSAAACTR